MKGLPSRALTAALVAFAWAAHPQSAQSQDAAATVAPAKARYRAIDRIDLDVDARKLTNGSNRRLIIVPRGSPDAVEDVNAFTEASVPVQASKARISLPPAPAGSLEARLLYIPTFQTSFVIAARANVEVSPGTPGAFLIHEFLDEANRIGVVRFTGKYKTLKPISIEGQYVRSEMTGSLRNDPDAPPQAWVYIGQPGIEARGLRNCQGAGVVACTHEAACIIDEKHHIAQVASTLNFKRGDTVVITGLFANIDSFAVKIVQCTFSAPPPSR